MAEGLVLDVLTRIINVQWGGLAVEFGDKAQDSPGVKQTSATRQEMKKS